MSKKKTLYSQAEKSDLPTIILEHKELGKIKFNLIEELKINEAKINYELTQQPSLYAYIGILHNKIIHLIKEKKRLLDKYKADLYVKKKRELNPSTNRPWDKETVNMAVESDPKYNLKLKDINKWEYKRGLISTALNSFEQRGYMIQTLSANTRKISNQ